MVKNNLDNKSQGYRRNNKSNLSNPSLYTNVESLFLLISDNCIRFHLDTYYKISCIICYKKQGDNTILPKYTKTNILYAT